MAHGRPSNYRTLASLSRINLLNELQQRGSQTVGQLAEATGLHHNTAREHLNRLIVAGLVSSEPIPAKRKGRPTIRYRAASRREGGRNPSTPGEQLNALGEHMHRCGFDAVIETGKLQMVMHDCPFAELAREHPQVCQVHFELVKDALQQAEGSVQAQELHPFFTPQDCVVDLRLER